MGRRNTLVFMAALFLIMLYSTSAQGRKLLMDVQHNKVHQPLDARLYLTALPKGNVPSSAPSKKGHSVTIDEKLVARHLSAIDRILRSVPSPGAGH
ncbi:UNVERIFIED_CONTAM: Precursor of CEP14 [Sesamum radiatum]|uniref:Precursor of CEP14 n=1 Tax=Sesamum radiatum TaxID=300843 RepID=A0AAW2LRK7_SESRA